MDGPNLPAGVDARAIGQADVHWYVQRLKATLDADKKRTAPFCLDDTRRLSLFLGYVSQYAAIGGKKPPTCV